MERKNLSVKMSSPSTVEKKFVLVKRKILRQALCVILNEFPP